MAFTHKILKTAIFRYINTNSNAYLIHKKKYSLIKKVNGSQPYKRNVQLELLFSKKCLINNR